MMASATRPDEDRASNWLPAPDGDFSLYLRAYWPGRHRRRNLDTTRSRARLTPHPSSLRISRFSR